MAITRWEPFAEIERWEPFRWEPTREIEQLQRQINQMSISYFHSQLVMRSPPTLTNISVQL